MQPRRDPKAGFLYYSSFLSAAEREQVLHYLGGLHPIWEKRFSSHRPLPPNQTQRLLLRPVYWLGGWQFACHGYYRPPQRTLGSVIAAEPIPAVLASILAKVEKLARSKFPANFFPAKWHLNTCLINYYGTRVGTVKSEDTARLGEHRDFEPGPVASISFGDRAFFQFVESQGRDLASRPVVSQWLEDSSLQVFGGPLWKDRYFHRVQRVEKKHPVFAVPTEGFETRRINLTFRYVPSEHILPLDKLAGSAFNDIAEYVQRLAHHSAFFEQALTKRGSAGEAPGT